MNKDFKVNLSFNLYDVMMLAAMIAHARRYGDNQLSDWAGDLRDRIAKKSELPMTEYENNSPVRDVSAETEAKVSAEATKLLELLPEKSEPVKESAPKATPAKK